jgi:hydrogenase nickel incorporation protein HypB
MVKERLGDLELAKVKLLVIENIGNLVCPSTYDLGENLKVALLSVTEGGAGAVVLTKVDLLPYVNFDAERARNDCRKLNPQVRFFSTSCKTGEGMEEWFGFLKNLQTE